MLNHDAPTDREQVNYLLEIIDRMVSGQENSFYMLEMQEASRRAEEQTEISLEQSCSSPQERPRVFHQCLKKGLGVFCGGLFGSFVGFAGSDQTPVILLAVLAGAVGAYTAMHRGQ